MLTWFSLLATEIHNCRHFPIMVSDFSYHKFNMAAAKPEVLKSRAVYWIAAKFQRLHLCFRGQPVHWHAPRCLYIFPCVAIGFRIYASIIRCWSMFHCIGHPWKRGTSTWNCTSIWYTTKVITTSCFKATILDFHTTGHTSSVGRHAM